MALVRRAGEFEAPSRRTILHTALDPWIAGQLREMMETTVHGGTSLEAFTNDEGKSYLGGIRVAGKTGTLKPTTSDPTTTWFIGFAPSRHPRLVVSVLLQNGDVWRRRANEVARDLFRVYFAKRGARGVTNPFEHELR
jgi:cell division protein FtsI/penicillin-binding protein 2